MVKQIVELSYDPHTVSLADRRCSLVIDPETGFIFMDEGDGEGRVNGAVLLPFRLPRFAADRTAGQGQALIIEYVGVRIVVGSTQDEAGLQSWIASANGFVAGKAEEAGRNVEAASIVPVPTPQGTAHGPGPIGREQASLTQSWQDWLAAKRSGRPVLAQQEDELFNTLRRHVVAVIRARGLPDPNDLDDIAQNVMVTLNGLSARPAGDPRDITQFVAAVARKRMLDHFRRTYRRRSHAGPAEPEDVGAALDQIPSADPPPERMAEHQETFERLDAVVRGMTPEQGKLFDLRVIKGMRIGAIARALGTTKGVVKGRLARLREALRAFRAGSDTDSH